MAVWGWWGKAILNIYRNCRDAASWERQGSSSHSAQKCYSLARGKKLRIFQPHSTFPYEDPLQHLRGHAWGKLMVQFCRRIGCVFWKWAAGRCKSEIQLTQAANPKSGLSAQWQHMCWQCPEHVDWGIACSYHERYQPPWDGLEHSCSPEPSKGTKFLSVYELR